MSAMRVRDRLLGFCSIVVLVLALATPAWAGQVTPQIQLVSASVTGPGLKSAQALSDEAGTNVAKAWVASAAFSHRDAPPEDATIYTVHLVLDTPTGQHNNTLLFAWDGSNGWFSAGELLDKVQYLPAPAAVVAALKPVVDAAAPHAGSAATTSTTSDGGSSVAVWIILGVLALAILAAAGFVWQRRRRTPRTAAPV